VLFDRKKIKMCINKIRERKKEVGWWINRKKYAKQISSLAI